VSTAGIAKVGGWRPLQYKYTGNHITSELGRDIDDMMLYKAYEKSSAKVVR